jgi:fructan beta-fructosidase
MHWGHAVSPDLIHWETLPIALYPDELGTMFSGCVVIDANNTSGLVPGGGLVALFTYHTQAQGAAYSTDRGRTWTKYAGNPIIPALRQDFRDPKVLWHNGKWVMVLSAGTSLMFLSSPDLLHWEITGEFNGGYEAGVWEVPDLFPMTIDGSTKWVLIISVNPTAPAGGSGTRYCIGSFDGRTFIDDYPDQRLWFDWGADDYAGTTFYNAPEGRYQFVAWMNNWAYAELIPTSVWRGALTIPRELRLLNTEAGVRLAQSPVDALHRLRVPLGQWERFTVGGTLALDSLAGQALDLEIEFELRDAQVFGVELFSTEMGGVQLSYDAKTQQLVFRRSNGDIDNFNPAYSAPLVAVDQRIRLRILVDRSSVEIFTADGLLTMTSQVFPEVDTPCIRLFTLDGAVHVRSLCAYQIQSIWKT